MRTPYPIATLLLLASIALIGCDKIPFVHSQSVSAIFAGCESDAYLVIGVQADNRASLQYLERKYELVRVCLIKNKLRFKSSEWGLSNNLKLMESVFTRYGIYDESPSSEKYGRYIGEATQEWDRQRLVVWMNSTMWEF